MCYNAKKTREKRTDGWTRFYNISRSEPPRDNTWVQCWGLVRMVGNECSVGAGLGWVNRVGLCVRG